MPKKSPLQCKCGEYLTFFGTQGKKAFTIDALFRITEETIPGMIDVGMANLTLVWYESDE